MPTITNYKLVYIYTIASIIILSTNLALKGQPLTPADHGLKHFQIDDQTLGTISFYLDTVNLDQPSPLFLDINGSGGLPLCLYVKSEKMARLLNTFNSVNLEQSAQRYHYIVLDKPGTPFCDSLEFQEPLDSIGNERLLTSYPASKEYHRRLSLEWRVSASKKVLNWLIDHHYWDDTNILAYGYSEGAQVAPALAIAEPKITHVVALVGSGLNQLYDRTLNWRIQANRGIISHQTAQDSIDQHQKLIADIYAHPDAIDRFYDGHSYKRWASFYKSEGKGISLLQKILFLICRIRVFVKSFASSYPKLVFVDKFRLQHFHCLYF